MRKQDRLGALKMRVPGDDSVAMRCGDIEQGFLRTPQRERSAINFVAQPQTQVGRDLIVSAASGVQLTAGVANHFYQPRLDKRMHIF